MARTLGRRVIDAPVLDRPERRPGAHRHTLDRRRGLLRPPVVVEEPPPGALHPDHDVGVTTRHGAVLRVNVYRPPGAGRSPCTTTSCSPAIPLVAVRSWNRRSSRTAAASCP